MTLSTRHPTVPSDDTDDDVAVMVHVRGRVEGALKRLGTDVSKARGRTIPWRSGATAAITGRIAKRSAWPWMIDSGEKQSDKERAAEVSLAARGNHKTMRRLPAARPAESRRAMRRERGYRLSRRRIFVSIRLARLETPAV